MVPVPNCGGEVSVTVTVTCWLTDEPFDAVNVYVVVWVGATYVKLMPVTLFRSCPEVSPTESIVMLVAPETDHDSFATVPRVIDAGEAETDEMVGCAIHRLAQSQKAKLTAQKRQPRRRSTREGMTLSEAVFARRSKELFEIILIADGLSVRRQSNKAVALPTQMNYTLPEASPMSFVQSSRKNECAGC